jgi:hypothetical protein
MSDSSKSHALAEQLNKLRERIENIEDLIELRAAVQRNAGKPGIPWNDAKVKLDVV